MGSNNNQFTNRELEILLLMSEGCKNSEIAKKLYISNHTVEAHKAHLKIKLNLKSAIELTVFAVKNSDKIKMILEKELMKSPRGGVAKIII